MNRPTSTPSPDVGATLHLVEAIIRRYDLPFEDIEWKVDLPPTNDLKTWFGAHDQVTLGKFLELSHQVIKIIKDLPPERRPKPRMIKSNSNLLALGSPLTGELERFERAGRELSNANAAAEPSQPTTSRETAWAAVSPLLELVFELFRLLAESELIPATELKKSLRTFLAELPDDDVS